MDDILNTRELDTLGEESPTRKPWTAPVLTVADVAEVTQANVGIAGTDGTGYS